MKKFIDYLSKTSVLTYALITAGIVYSFSLLLRLFLYHTVGDIVFMKSIIEDSDIFTIVIAGLVVAPLLETLVFQLFPYKIFKKHKVWKLVLFTSIVFSLTHFTTILNIMHALICGAALMFGFIIRERQENKAFTSTALTHAFMNLVPVSVMVIRKIPDFLKTLENL